MEVINAFWVICLIAFGIFMGAFQVLLMFKLWNMWEDVKRLKILLKKAKMEKQEETI